MTDEEMLEAHIRELDHKVGELRAIIRQPHYDNDESPEVKNLMLGLNRVVREAFDTKKAIERARHYSK